MKQIYLDNAATTRVDSRVLKAMLPFLKEKYGNASSQHSLGIEAKKAIENSREIIAKAINSETEEIIFTSGGTEANNLALKGLFFNANNKKENKNHIITTKIEHASIVETCKWLETQGAKVTYLDVDKEGLINLNELKEKITPETLVVSVIHGNNEIGTLQNIEKIGEICKEKGVYLHLDACQSFLKTDIDVKKQNIDLMTLNAHKVYGPKGVGALYAKKEILDEKKLTPLLHGGGHEKNLRSGTENVAGIIGFSEAVRIYNRKDNENIRKLRDYCMKEILKIKGAKLNEPLEDNRLCNNLNVSFGNVEGEAIASCLEEYNIFVSTGSACASNSLKKSHVLKAIGLNDMEINSSIRVSLSRETTKKEIDYFVTKLRIIVEKLRKMSPFSN